MGRADGRKRWLPVIVTAILAVCVVGAGIFYAGTHRKVKEGEIYLAQGHLTRMEAPLNDKMVAHASRLFNEIYESYLKPEQITPYLAVIPDKNYYLTEDKQERALDYEALVRAYTEANPYMTYLDITQLLTLSDYYITDSHWRQEDITDVADFLAEQMGATLDDEYRLTKLDELFYGAYYEDGENRVSPDTICYLDSDLLESCTVTDIGEGKPLAIYDVEKAKEDFAYDLFLSGTVALLSIDNPNATSDKRLIIFRDSYASSLAPLLVSGYRQIVMIDIRYVQSKVLGELVDFSDADVLFLYSTLLLNNSMGMK